MARIWLIGTALSGAAFANTSQENSALALEGRGHTVTRINAPALTSQPTRLQCDVVIHIDGSVGGETVLRATNANAAPIIGTNSYYMANDYGNLAVNSSAPGTNDADDQIVFTNVTQIPFTGGYAVNDVVTIAASNVYMERLALGGAAGNAFIWAQSNTNIFAYVGYGWNTGATNLAGDVTTARIATWHVFSNIGALNTAGLQILDDLIDWVIEIPLAPPTYDGIEVDFKVELDAATGWNVWIMGAVFGDSGFPRNWEQAFIDLGATVTRKDGTTFDHAPTTSDCDFWVWYAGDITDPDWRTCTAVNAAPCLILDSAKLSNSNISSGGAGLASGSNGFSFNKPNYVCRNNSITPSFQVGEVFKHSYFKDLGYSPNSAEWRIGPYPVGSIIVMDSGVVGENVVMAFPAGITNTFGDVTTAKMAFWGMDGTYTRPDSLSEKSIVALEEIMCWLTGDPVNPAWADISGYCESVNTTRGRTRPLEDFLPGTCSITARNEDGRFDPVTPDSVYPRLDVGTKCRVSVVVDGSPERIFSGKIQSWNANIGSATSLVTLNLTDAFSQLSGVNLASCIDDRDFTPPTIPGSSVEQRIAEILACRDVKTDKRIWNGDFQTVGQGVLELGPREATGGALQEIMLSSKSEGGIGVFIDRFGTLTHMTRYSAVSAQPDFILSDGSYDEEDHIWISTDGLQVSRDFGLLYNLVSVFRWDFTGELGNVPETASDLASQEAFGLRELSLSQILLDYTAQGDGPSQNLADYNLALYKDTAVQLGAIQINPFGVNNRDIPDTQKRGQLVSLARAEPSEVILVKLDLPSTTWSTNNEVIIDQVSHSISPGKNWKVTILGSTTSGNIRSTPTFLLDSGAFGRLDTNELAI